MGLMQQEAMLEDEVIRVLEIALQREGWTTVHRALGRERGIDLQMTKGGLELVAEAKGARGNPKNHGVVRAQFDMGQIKDHLGKAIVKACELVEGGAGNRICVIAQPDIEKIREASKPVIAQLATSESAIRFVFVKTNGELDWPAGPPGR